MFKKWRDLGLGVFMLAFSVFYIFQASTIKINAIIMGSHASYANGRIVPYLLGILMAILSVGLIVTAVIKMKKNAQEEKSGEKNELSTVLLTFLIIIAYIALLPTLGFILGTILFLIAQIFVLAPAETRVKKLWVYALVAVVFTVLIYIAFNIGLSQPLPRGVIENLFNLG